MFTEFLLGDLLKTFFRGDWSSLVASRRKVTAELSYGIDSGNEGHSTNVREVKEWRGSGVTFAIRIAIESFRRMDAKP
jgi:hypothetical protein